MFTGMEDIAKHNFNMLRHSLEALVHAGSDLHDCWEFCTSNRLVKCVRFECEHMRNSDGSMVQFGVWAPTRKREIEAWHFFWLQSPRTLHVQFSFFQSVSRVSANPSVSPSKSRLSANPSVSRNPRAVSANPRVSPNACNVILNWGGFSCNICVQTSRRVKSCE